jgi:hypothetical protein
MRKNLSLCSYLAGFSTYPHLLAAHELWLSLTIVPSNFFHGGNGLRKQYSHPLGYSRYLTLIQSFTRGGWNETIYINKPIRLGDLQSLSRPYDTPGRPDAGLHD